VSTFRWRPYAPGTGSRLRIFAGAFALILVVTFLVIQHTKGRDEAMLGAETASIAELAPQVDVVKVARWRHPPRS
jgi:hypothetical protein